MKARGPLLRAGFATCLGFLLAGCPKPGSDKPRARVVVDEDGRKKMIIDAPPGTTLKVRPPEDLWREARATRDPAHRVELLETLHAKVEGSPKEHVARELAMAYAEVGKIERMEAMLDAIEIEPDLAGAQVQNAVAYAYAEKGIKLDLARRLVMQALNTLDRSEAEGPPPGADVGQEEFLRFVDENRAYYLDTLGWIEHRAGKGREAVAVLQEAARRVEHAAIRFHLAEVHRALGDGTNAAKAYARSAALDDGEESAKARAALEQMVKEGKLREAEKKALLQEAESQVRAVREKERSEREARELEERSQSDRRRDRERKEAEAGALEDRMEEKSPRFTLQDFDGRRIDSETLSRQVTVLDFWATWCGPCRLELPIYQQIYDRYKTQVRFVAVSVDKSRDLAEEYIKEASYTFPIAFDGDGTLSRVFQIEGIPTIVVIGPCGNINWVHQGFNPQIDVVLTSQIEQLLKEKNQRCAAESGP